MEFGKLILIIFTKTSHKKNQSEIQEKLNILESVIKNNHNPLAYPIPQQELNEKLKSIKSKKACGVDNINIRNEMLKNSTPELQNAVLKLFNMVLTSGCFPDVMYCHVVSCLCPFPSPCLPLLVVVRVPFLPRFPPAVPCLL